MTQSEEIILLRSENAQFRLEHTGFREKIELLTQEVMSLQEKLKLILNSSQKKPLKKNSGNSSLPPSVDMTRVSRSLREASGLPAGGQAGHKGHTLKIIAAPDHVVNLKSSFCQKCGQPLAEDLHLLQATRQVVDIVPVKLVCTEYKQYCCKCPYCKHRQKHAFPAGVNAPVQYGTNVATMAAYFSVYQYLPYNRLKQLFSHIFGLSLSAGTLDNLLIKASEKAQPVYDGIKAQILKSTVIGSDETSCKVKKEKQWIWVWQNLLNTFIIVSATRGFAAIGKEFKDGFPNATVVSDRWAAQLKVVAKNHQLCTAHLLRECKFLKADETDDQSSNAFAQGIRSVIKQGLDLRKTWIAGNIPADKEHPTVKLIEKQFNELLAISLDDKTYPQTIVFQKSLLKHRAFMFPFLYNLDVPPDNNGSERAIRNVKVKQKISGHFKTGQKVFCVLRSVIDTLIKRNMNIFQMLNQIVMIQPE
jgi:transposase